MAPKKKLRKDDVAKGSSTQVALEHLASVDAPLALSLSSEEDDGGEMTLLAPDAQGSNLRVPLPSRRLRSYEPTAPQGSGNGSSSSRVATTPEDAVVVLATPAHDGAGTTTKTPRSVSTVVAASHKGPVLVLPSAVDDDFLLAHGRMTQFQFEPEEMMEDEADNEQGAKRARQIAALEEIPDYLVSTYIRMADAGVPPADRMFAAIIAFRAADAVHQWKGEADTTT